MKKLSTMGVALLAIVLASSCGSSKNALQTSALEGEWNIITVNGKEATADKDVFIGLNLKENRVYGCAGCNRIMGAIQVDKDKGRALCLSAGGFHTDALQRHGYRTCRAGSFGKRHRL